MSDGHLTAIFCKKTYVAVACPSPYTDLHTEVRLEFRLSVSMPMAYGFTQSHFPLQVGIIRFFPRKRINDSLMRTLEI
jgi:hypothetical protein